MPPPLRLPDTDVIIAGGGPAGPVLAIELGRRGGSVALFDDAAAAVDVVRGAVGRRCALAGPALVVNPALLPPAEAWPAPVMLGLFSAAAHILFARGCLVAPADRVSPLDYTAVFFAAVFGWPIWGERVDWLPAAGAAPIVAGAVIAIRAGRPGADA